MNKDSPVPELVRAAAQGDQNAWNDLVERYSPMLVSVVRQYRLSPAHVDDVAQTVWLRLVEHLGDLREPEALPGWIVTTARREAVRLITAERRSSPFDPQAGMDAVLSEGAGRVADGELDEELLRSEKHRALLAGLAELPDRQRKLLLLLLADPPLSYAQISAQTQIAVGSIGPTRGRAIERLRQSEPIRQFLDASIDTITRLEPDGR
jgi:RNA polymerase sigma factor (sigma-70 family)